MAKQSKLNEMKCHWCGTNLIQDFNIDNFSGEVICPGADCKRLLQIKVIKGKLQGRKTLSKPQFELTADDYVLMGIKVEEQLQEQLKSGGICPLCRRPQTSSE